MQLVRSEAQWEDGQQGLVTSGHCSKGSRIPEEARRVLRSLRHGVREFLLVKGQEQASLILRQEVEC